MSNDKHKQVRARHIKAGDYILYYDANADVHRGHVKNVNAWGPRELAIEFTDGNVVRMFPIQFVYIITQ